MFCWRKDKLYKNPKVDIIPVSKISLIDYNNPFTGINFRPLDPINYCLETESLIGSKDILTNKTNKETRHFFDSEEVLEYKDVVLFRLACQKYGRVNYRNHEYRIKNALIDKTYNLLIVFDTIDDMYSYISGRNFNYCYGICLNSYINLTLCKPRFIKDIKFEVNKNKKSLMYECTLIKNDETELVNKNIDNHFNNFIKINKLFKFSSVHPDKMKLFKETIEKIVGFKIVYDK